MIIVDSTRKLSTFLLVHCPQLRVIGHASHTSHGDYKAIGIVVGTRVWSFFGLFSREVEDIKQLFEVWNERRVEIIPKTWKETLSLISPSVSMFEKQTNQRIDIVKVETFTKFSDY